jgi:hypothetical protein
VKIITFRGKTIMKLSYLDNRKSQKYRTILKKVFLVSSLTCNQIWFIVHSPCGWMSLCLHHKIGKEIFATTFLLLSNFRQIPTWKIWFRPRGRIFHEKNGQHSPDFKKKILPIARILLLVPVSSQKYRKIFIISYFHISTCG